MVVLAASICTASGKVILSRQFVEVPRSRIEGLLAAFPKLIGAGSQHTVVETENIRYVYQSIGNLFLVLLSNRQSNILQDIETLRLLGQVVSKVCHSTEEEKIVSSAFELLSAFDEIVSLGYRDTVTLSQLSTIIEMESHEERIQEIIAQNKEKEAKEKMKEKIKMMDEQRKREALGGRQSKSSFESSSSSYQSSKPALVSQFRTTAPSKPKASGGGMKLGAAPKNNFVSASQFDSDYADDVEESIASVNDNEYIHFNLEEKIMVQTERDGSLSSFELRGDLSVQTSDSKHAHFKAHIDAPTIDGVQFMTNPKIDKTLFNNERILALKDSTKGFPLNQNVGILKWKLLSKEPTTLPFSVICWISPSDEGVCDVDVEVTLEGEGFYFEDLALSIPMPGGVEPEVGDCNGSYEIQDDTLLWELPVINDENKEAALHFQCHSEDQGNCFFPVSVSFSTQKLLSGLQVTGVMHSDTNDELTFSQESTFFAEEFTIS